MIQFHVARKELKEAQEYANDPKMRKNYAKSNIVVVETTPVSAELIVKDRDIWMLYVALDSMLTVFIFSLLVNVVFYIYRDK